MRIDTDNFSSPLTTSPPIATSMSDKPNKLKMPKRINLSEDGLRCLERICKQRPEAATKGQKAHIIYGATTRIVYILLTLFALTSKFTMPKHCVDSNKTFTDWLVNRFHEVNEHCDGTLNQVHHFSSLLI